MELWIRLPLIAGHDADTTDYLKAGYRHDVAKLKCNCPNHVTQNYWGSTWPDTVTLEKVTLLRLFDRRIPPTKLNLIRLKHMSLEYGTRYWNSSASWHDGYHRTRNKPYWFGPHNTRGNALLARFVDHSLPPVKYRHDTLINAPLRLFTERSPTGVSYTVSARVLFR